MKITKEQLLEEIKIALRDEFDAVVLLDGEEIKIKFTAKT